MSRRDFTNVTQHAARLRPEDRDTLQRFLDDLRERPKRPGISAAVIAAGAAVEAAAGSRVVGTGDTMTVGTCFELGSIQKLLTALVVLELANEQFIDLDRPISSYLPELRGCN